jgi:hypothetical protein
VPIILDQLFGIERRQPFGVKQKVFLYFIANHLGQNQLAHLGGAE